MDSRSEKRSTAWPLAVASAGISVLVVGILAVAWIDSEPSARPSGRQPTAVAALCASAGAADANNRGEARRVFVDDAHDRLHRLADRTLERDRGAAQHLLRAKERVEANLENPRAGLVEDLADLADATRAALRVVGDRVPPPCELDDR